MSTTINFNAVSYASVCYENQHGATIKTLPDYPTIYGGKKAEQEFMQLEVYRNQIDRWTFRVTFQLRNSHSLTYYGNDAAKRWAAWQQFIFGRRRSTKQRDSRNSNDKTDRRIIQGSFEFA